jgi:TRAP-type C4-dicarboxylate transport system substrate-binding protein
MRRIDHHLNVRSWALACAVLAAIAVAGGCDSDSGEDKAGNESTAKPVELVLANHEGGSDNVGEWAEAAERLSGGSIRIRISNNWRPGESNYEEAILNDVRRGDIPLASVQSRALDEVGVTSFQPLAAPFLIDSADLQQRVLESDVAERALAGTEQIGMVGLALLPNDLRRPVGLTQTLAAPDDYRGARVYTREGKVAAATLEALGAQPAHGPDETWFEKVDGAEIGLRGVRGQPEVARQDARITSNVVLWAQSSTIVMNKDAFEDLSDDQQRALREAAAEAFDERSRVVNKLQAEDLQAVCRMGARLVEATPSQREALEAAVEPVYRMIERSPGNAEAVATIRELKGDAEPDTVDCGGTSEPASDAQTPEPELEGTFRTTLTEDELANSPLLYDAGEVNDENWGELTLELSDGQVRYAIENKRASWESSGTYTTDGDIIKMEFDSIGETWGYRWSLYRGTLKFERDESLGVPPELHAPTPLLVNPWERID